VTAREIQQEVLQHLSTEPIGPDELAEALHLPRLDVVKALIPLICAHAVALDWKVKVSASTQANKERKSL
jgi:hypothetical protein